MPVCSNKSKLMSCFLEYSKEQVKVHDLVYENKGNEWILKKSCCTKLRLSEKWVYNQLKEKGFQILSSGIENGMYSVIAEK